MYYILHYYIPAMRQKGVCLRGKTSKRTARPSSLGVSCPRASEREESLQSIADFYLDAKVAEINKSLEQKSGDGIIILLILLTNMIITIIIIILKLTS